MMQHLGASEKSETECPTISSRYWTSHAAMVCLYPTQKPEQMGHEQDAIGTDGNHLGGSLGELTAL